MVASSATGDSTPSLRSAIMRGGFLKVISNGSLFILVARFGLFHLNPYFEQEPPEGASEEG